MTTIPVPTKGPSEYLDCKKNIQLIHYLLKINLFSFDFFSLVRVLEKPH
jgi:hypothetical protein